MVPRLSPLLLSGSISINCYIVIKEFNMHTSMATKGALLFDVVPIGHNPHTRIGNPVRIISPPNILAGYGQSNGISGYHANVLQHIPNDSDALTPTTVSMDSVSTMTMDSVGTLLSQSVNEHTSAISEEDIEDEIAAVLPHVFPVLETHTLGSVPLLTTKHRELISGVMGSSSIYGSCTEVTNGSNFTKYPPHNTPIVAKVPARDILDILDCSFDAGGYVIKATLKKLPRGYQARFVKKHFGVVKPKFFYICLCLNG